MKKNVLKKLVALFCLTSLLAGCFVGCASNTETNEPSFNAESGAPAVQEETKAKGGLTLAVALPTSWNRGATAEAFKLYEEATGNKIEAEVIPDDQCVALLQTRISTNTDVPDLVLQCQGVFTETQLSENFVPLNGEWIDRLDKTHLEMAYKHHGDGNIYQAPYGSSGCAGLMYNKKIMADNGIEVPIKNYDDLLAACDKLVAAGIVPFSMPSKENWPNQMLVENQWYAKMTDQEAVDFKAAKLSLKDITGCREVFEHAVELCERGYFNEDHMSTTMDMALEDVAMGEAAMCPAGDWSYMPVHTNFPEQADNCGMMYSPMLNDLQFADISLSSKCVFVTKNGVNENVEAALGFVDFLMSDDTLLKIFEVEPGICPVSGLDNAMTDWGREMSGYRDGGIPCVPQWPCNPVGVGNCSPYMVDMFSGKSIDDALDDWYRDITNTAKAAQIEGWA